MTEATWAKARKLATFLADRVATRRYGFACDQNRSTTFRPRYTRQSTRRTVLRLRFGSMAGSAPRPVPGQQPLGLLAIGRLAAGQERLDRVAERATAHVHLGAEPARPRDGSPPSSAAAPTAG
jgi:hypothetical protein